LPICTVGQVWLRRVNVICVGLLSFILILHFFAQYTRNLRCIVVVIVVYFVVAFVEPLEMLDLIVTHMSIIRQPLSKHVSENMQH
jgi:hypothetical protein